MREGDTAKAGAPLFAVDTDLQRADLMMNEAALINAQQAYDRASKTAQDRLRNREGPRGRGGRAAQRPGPRRYLEDPARPPQNGEPRHRHGAAGLFPAGRDWCRPAGRSSRCCRPAISRSASMCRKPCCRASPMASRSRSTATAARPTLPARVSFIARLAEFTPPVIYSREERSKLVYLIEALPEQPDALRVGQPIDVALAETATQARGRPGRSLFSDLAGPSAALRAGCRRPGTEQCRAASRRPPPPGAKP